jgi:hypothetical protein
MIIKEREQMNIDFLRLPRPQGLPAGRQGSEEPTKRSEELGEAKINLLPLGLG